jgi:hypothetical protein
VCHQLKVTKISIKVLFSSTWNQFGTHVYIYLDFQKSIYMHTKNIKHIIIILKSNNILILIIKLKNISKKIYIEIYFRVTFTKKTRITNKISLTCLHLTNLTWEIKPYGPKIDWTQHYYKMRPSSLWVSLDFEWIWTFLLSEII